MSDKLGKTYPRDSEGKRYVQVQSPVTKRYAVIDKTTGSIVRHSKSKRPYKAIKIIGEEYCQQV